MTTRILLVDDDMADQSLFAGYIRGISKENDYVLETISSYDHGLKAVLNKDHDIYFVDYTLGELTGMDLIETAVQQGVMGPYIILTGMDRPDLYQSSSKTHVFDYLLKDELSPSILQRTITYTIQRRNIEASLIYERNLVRNIIRDVPYIVMRVDDEGAILEYNPYFIEISGYKDNEVKTKKWLDFFTVKTNQFSQAVNFDESFQRTLLCKGGGSRVIEWDILNEASYNKELVMIGKDITAQLAQEEEKRRQDKMQALGHLAGGVAHEINNLLQPIILNADIIRDCDDKSELYEISSDIIQSATIASSIVEDILIFARKDNRKFEKLNLLNTVDEAVKILKTMVPKTIEFNIKNISVSAETRCLFYLKDLVRVLSNLVKNAAHSMDNKGRITLNLSQDDYHNKNHVKIDIVDNGVGIPADKLDSIFNAFYTTKDVGQGTGLGLTMCYNIVQNWGGHISVISEEDQGACFSVYIPVYEEEKI